MPSRGVRARSPPGLLASKADAHRFKWFVAASTDSISGKQAWFIHLLGLVPRTPFILSHFQKVYQH